jgi:hypothetical protein
VNRRRKPDASTSVAWKSGEENETPERLSDSRDQTKQQQKIGIEKQDVQQNAQGKQTPRAKQGSAFDTPLPEYHQPKTA